MSEQTQRGGGRHIERNYPVKRVTLELPQGLWDYITSVSDNRTEWIVETLETRRKEEQRKKRVSPPPSN